MSTTCLKCGGTGITATGEPCDCGVKMKMIIPDSLKVPMQYQGVRFDKMMLRSEQQGAYGTYMEKLLRDCTESFHTFHKNVLICAPPNSGKTIWSYTVQGLLYAKGIKMPEFMDIMQVHSVLLSYYGYTDEEVFSVSNSPLAIFKIPTDLPSKFADTMLTVIERRVRCSGSTIFMYSGSWEDMKAQDTFNKLKYVVGDGSYNSIEVQSFF